MRAVLDANILISALLSPGGAPARLLLRWQAGEFELVVSAALLGELERTFAYPKLAARIPPVEAKRFIGALRRTATVAADPDDPAPRSVDPDDDYLIALAESSSAILVSGDQHLLGLSEQMPIWTDKRFLDALCEAAEAERR